MTSPLERIKEVNYNVWFLNFPRRAAVNITMRKRQTLVEEKKKKKGQKTWMGNSQKKIKQSINMWKIFNSSLAKEIQIKTMTHREYSIKVKRCKLKSLIVWIWILTMSLTRCVTSGKLLKLLVSLFFIYKLGIMIKPTLGLPWCLSGKESDANAGGMGLNPWSGRIPHAIELLCPKSH